MANNREKFDFEPLDVNAYTDLSKTIGPDGFRCFCIYNQKKCQYAYIHSKRSAQDDSHYAPYIVYLLGKKAGIDVPETELKACLIPSLETGLYRDAFSQSSLVYINGTGFGPFFNRQVSFFPFSVVKSFYDNSVNGADNRTSYDTVDDYINANMYYISARQKTPISEEQKAEIRQKLVDNLMFGLKLGVRGATDIIESEYDNPRLNSFYLTSGNMLCLNLRSSKVSELINGKTSELAQFAEREFPTQYSVSGDKQSSVSEVVRYLYDKYPVETEKAYNKLKQIGIYNLKTTLDDFSEMNEDHKKLALKLFAIRQKTISEVHQEYEEKKVTR